MFKTISSFKLFLLSSHKYRLIRRPSGLGGLEIPTRIPVIRGHSPNEITQCFVFLAILSHLFGASVKISGSSPLVGPSALP